MKQYATPKTKPLTHSCIRSNYTLSYDDVLAVARPKEHPFTISKHTGDMRFIGYISLLHVPGIPPALLLLPIVVVKKVMMHELVHEDI